MSGELKRLTRLMQLGKIKRLQNQKLATCLQKSEKALFQYSQRVERTNEAIYSLKTLQTKSQQHLCYYHRLTSEAINAENAYRKAYDRVTEIQWELKKQTKVAEKVEKQATKQLRVIRFAQELAN